MGFCINPQRKNWVSILHSRLRQNPVNMGVNRIFVFCSYFFTLAEALENMYTARSSWLCVAYRVVFPRLEDWTSQLKCETKTAQLFYCCFFSLVLATKLQVAIVSSNEKLTTPNFFVARLPVFATYLLKSMREGVCRYSPLLRHEHDALSRSTIFGVWHCFATHIHMRHAHSHQV